MIVSFPNPELNAKVSAPMPPASVSLPAPQRGHSPRCSVTRRDLRLDLRNLDVVVGVERRLRDARHVGPAMATLIDQNIAPARRIKRYSGRCAPGCDARGPFRSQSDRPTVSSRRGRRARIVRVFSDEAELRLELREPRPAAANLAGPLQRARRCCEQARAADRRRINAISRDVGLRVAALQERVNLAALFAGQMEIALWGIFPP